MYKRVTNGQTQQCDELLPPLPPGQYYATLWGVGASPAETERVSIPFVVTEATPDLDLGNIVLSAPRHSRFQGKTAPEFFEVRNFRDNTPMRLEDARGKVVLLHFSLGRTRTERKAALRRYHDADHKAGLEVVVIHPPDADMSAIEKGLPDAPYLQAVDGGGRTLVEGTNRHVSGVTGACYGVQNSVTLYLIDREGRLVTAHVKWDIPGAAEELLEGMLGLRSRGTGFARGK